MAKQNPSKKFAFLAHPTSMEDLYSSGPPGLSELSPEHRRNWESWIASWSAQNYDPGVFHHVPSLRSRADVTTEGWLIGIPLTPKQMMRLRPGEKTKLMQNCVKTARQLGADILGLGAFTSIITRNGTDMAGCGMPVTTGSSLTAIAASESIKIAVSRRGESLSSANVGIIGAAGSIGRLACKNLVACCSHLTLFGNPENPQSIKKLKLVGGELYFDALQRLSDVDPLSIEESIGSDLLSIYQKLDQWEQDEPTDKLLNLYDYMTQCFECKGKDVPIAITVDINKDLPRMNYIVSATSNAQTVIDPSMLARDAIVCDVARPADITMYLANARPDVFVYEGGLVKLPENLSLGTQNLVRCPPGVNLACLSETMVLALAGKDRDYSVGMTTPLEEALEVYQLAKEHGFEVFLPPDPKVREPNSMHVTRH